MSTYNDTVVKIGLGGYLVGEELGEVKQVAGAITPAVHESISQDINLSMGISIGFDSTPINLVNFTVRDPGHDQTYLAYIASGRKKSGLQPAYGRSATRITITLAIL
ncbi:MAG: hypothetical protein MJA30_21365 [Cytophagales bacterium]|nr:hypothetical protein [Cytophagales bacterium]